MAIAVGWRLLVSLSVSDVLFMLVIRAVAVGWRLYVALLVGIMLFGMYFVGSLAVFDVLLLLVLMVGVWMWLVRWLGNVGLFALVIVSVAVGQLWWDALRLGRWAVAECCWLIDSVLSLCRWVVGI